MHRRLLKAIRFRLKQYSLDQYRNRLRLVFTTFADGKIHTSERLGGEAECSMCFDVVRRHSPGTLGPLFYEIYQQHMLHARGFGFWCWKPWIIRLEMLRLKPGDILVYADSGCTLGAYSAEAPRDIIAVRAVLLSLLSRFRDDVSLDIIVPQPFEHLEWSIAAWTKADLLHSFECFDNETVLNRQMIEANRLMLRHSPSVLGFLDAWCETAAQFNLISDTPSTHREHTVFREHRHDQAIFNMLLPKLNWGTGLEHLLHATRYKN